MPSLEMTQAEYARHRGVSRQMIGKLVANKKIPASAISPAKKIDAAAADLALGETIERVIARERDDETEQPHSGGGEASAAGTGLNKAKTAVAFYQANLARLQYEEKTGKLVSRADVELSMQRAAEALGRDIDQLAARADDIATAFTRSGVDGVRAFLKQTAREIRATIAGNMRLLEQSETALAETESEEQAA
jgi:hypothetical protein